MFEGGLIPPSRDCATLIDRAMCSSHPDSMTNDTRLADRTPTTAARLKENQGVEKRPIRIYLTTSVSHIPTNTNLLALYISNVCSVLH